VNGVKNNSKIYSSSPESFRCHGTLKSVRSIDLLRKQIVHDSRKGRQIEVVSKDAMLIHEAVLQFVEYNRHRVSTDSFTVVRASLLQGVTSHAPSVSTMSVTVKSAFLAAASYFVCFFSGPIPINPHFKLRRKNKHPVSSILRKLACRSYDATALSSRQAAARTTTTPMNVSNELTIRGHLELNTVIGAAVAACPLGFPVSSGPSKEEVVSRIRALILVV